MPRADPSSRSTDFSVGSCDNVLCRKQGLGGVEHGELHGSLYTVFQAAHVWARSADDVFPVASKRGGNCVIWHCPAHFSSSRHVWNNLEVARTQCVYISIQHMDSTLSRSAVVCDVGDVPSLGILGQEPKPATTNRSEPGLRLFLSFSCMGDEEERV
jgi:hypothetical protein